MKQCTMHNSQLMNLTDDFNELEDVDRVVLKGGIGVGTVTKDGLFVPKGAACH